MPLGKSRGYFYDLNDYSENTLLHSLKELQKDWQGVAADIRAGSVHKLLPSYLKRRSKDALEGVALDIGRVE